MAKQAIDKKTKELPMHESWPELDACRAIYIEMAAQIEMLQAQFDGLNREKLELETQGITHAGTHYRDGKYLYLIYPSKAGEPRQRDYVGADPVKVKEALESIERGQRWNQAVRQIESLQVRVRVLRQNLTSSLNAAMGKYGW